MKKRNLALAGVLLFATTPFAAAADLDAGRALFEQTCAACHGADAKTSTMPNYPILAGQHQDYLEHALVAYKRGVTGAPASANVRKNAIMGAMVAPLSATDIENISAWLATLPSPLTQR